MKTFRSLAEWTPVRPAQTRAAAVALRGAVAVLAVPAGGLEHQRRRRDRHLLELDQSPLGSTSVVEVFDLEILLLGGWVRRS